MPISAIIFDLDGTLVDSIPANYRAAKAAAAKFGIDFTEEDFAKVNGMTTREGFAWLVKEKGASLMINPLAIFREKRRAQQQINEETTIYPDTLATLDRLHQKYVLAIATSGSRRWLNTMDKRFGLKKHIQSATTSSDIKRSKPDPHIFLMAAQRIGKAANECAVIEDSLNGIIAAKRAGMTAIAILTTTKKKSFTGEATPDLFINNLGQLDARTLARAEQKASIRQQAER